MKNRALVVIDLQNDITKNYREIIEQVNKAIEWAVGNGMEIVYIRHNNLSAGTRTFKEGTHGAEFVPELKVMSGNIFTKTKSNALTSEGFTAFIREWALPSFISPVRMPRPVSNRPASIWQRQGIPSMYCPTASPATTRRSCRKCWTIMRRRDAVLRICQNEWRR